jgi:hypothetical protein
MTHQPPLEVLDNVHRDERQPLLHADDGLELGPFVLEPLLGLGLVTCGHLLKRKVDRWPLHLLQDRIRQAALIIDGCHRPVADRALNVVHADVVAEDGTRVRIGLLDGVPVKPKNEALGSLWRIRWAKPSIRSC